MTINPLKRLFKIIIPGTTAVNVPAAEMQADMVDLALINMSRLFGGATATTGTGAWMSDDKGLVRESIVIVSSHTDDDGMEKNREKALRLALLVGRRMKQESVAVEIDGKLYLMNVEQASNEAELAIAA